MKMMALKISGGGGHWVTVLADNQRQNRTTSVFVRVPGETLADAAARIEDLFRALAEGELKPCDVVALVSH